VVALGGALCLVVSLPASAQSLAPPFVGALTFSGPASPDLTSAYYNPAALGLRRGLRFQLAFLGARTAIDIARTPIDPTTGARVAPGTPGARSFPAVHERDFVPTGFVGFASDLGTDSLTLALAASTPFVTRRSVGAQSGAPGADGPTRYHLIDLTLYHILISPTLTVRITDWFSAALGADIIDSELGSITLDHDTALEGGTCSAAILGIENDACAERLHTTGQALSASIVVGLLVRPTAWLDLGFSYRSSAFNSSRANVPLIGREGRLTRPGSSEGVQLFSRLTLHVPHTFFFGAQLKLSPRWDLGMTVRWLHFADPEIEELRFSSIAANERNVPERIPLYRGYHDTAMARSVASWRRGPFRLGGGPLMSSPSVSNAEVSPAVVDGWQLGGVLLAEVALTKFLTFTVGYGLRGIIPRTVTTSIFDPLYAIDCVRSGHDIPTCRLANEGRGVPQPAGRYALLTQEFGTSLAFDF
jgi:long-chain fatty acid transport protein